MPISLALNSGKIKTSEFKGCNFPHSFWKSALYFSTYLTSMVAFYFLHLIFTKPLRVGVTSTFLSIIARICTLMKRGPRKPQNSRRPAVPACPTHLHRIWVSPFKTGFWDQSSFPSSYTQPSVCQEKVILQAGVEIQGIPYSGRKLKDASFYLLQRGNKR